MSLAVALATGRLFREVVVRDTMKERKALRVCIQTLGCRSNYADTVDLQAALVANGAVPCREAEGADVCVINTCTVTDTADKEAFKLIRRARARAPEARVVVTGCLAEVKKPDIEAHGLVDCIVGPGRIDELLRAVFGDFEVEEAVGLERVGVDGYVGPGAALGEVSMRARYHLRIQDGCENHCTYCIVPQSRGGYKSKGIEEICREIEELGELGFHEVVLSGTHLGGYGVDLGTTLYELLWAIERRAPFSRIRLSSIDPNDLSCNIIQLIAESHIFCRHLHICVQAFSDAVLKRMNRKYRVGDVCDMVGNILERIPGCCLGSDVLTGFPGESRKEVEQAIDIFLGLPFSYLHVFPYSERAGTAATRLSGSVAVAERKRRASRWRALGLRKKRDFLSGLVGKELEAVLESFDDTFCYGTSSEYAPVKIVHLGIAKDVRADMGKRRLCVASSFDAVDGRILCE